MSTLGPREPRHWHTADGRHTQPHPRDYEDRRSYWSTGQRAYAKHLDRHADLALNPEPMAGDPKVVADLFAHIARLESIIAKEKLLIIAVRQRAAEAPGHDDRDVADALRQGGIGS